MVGEGTGIPGYVGRGGSPGRARAGDPAGGVGYASLERSSSAAAFGSGGLVCHVPSAAGEEAAVSPMRCCGSSCLNVGAKDYRRPELGRAPLGYWTPSGSTGSPGREGNGEMILDDSLTRNLQLPRKRD